MGIILSIIVLGVVIALHELGHFAVAKWCKVGVLEYAIGFGKAIFSRRFGETRYSLRMIPLGGYVRMVGDDPYSVAQSQNPEGNPDMAAPVLSTPEQWSAGVSASADSKKDKLPEPDPVEMAMLADKSKWFLMKPVWAKAAIVFAGPAANLISAFAIGAFTLAVWGATVPVDLPVIGQVMPGYPAAKAGMERGDKVISVDGKPMTTWEELSGTVRSSGGKEMTFLIERAEEGGGVKTLELKATGVIESSEMEFLDSRMAVTGYKIGIGVAGKRVDVSVWEAAKLAGMHIAKLSWLTVKGILGLVIGEISLKNIGGPIFIFGETMRSADQGIANLLEFVVFLSVSLAVLNLLPIPVLDGGHLVFFAIEAIKGSPVSLRFMELSQQVGMVLLLALTALAVGNDVLRLFHG